MALSLPPLALYIHIPWCIRKCPYCDFNSHEAREIPEAEYVAALLRDLNQDLDSLPFPARHLLKNNIYISPETGNPLTVVHGNRGCPARRGR